MSWKLCLVKRIERGLTTYHRTADKSQITAAEALADAAALLNLVDTPKVSPERVALDRSFLDLDALGDKLDLIYGPA